MRFGAVFGHCKSYGAVRCCYVSYGAVRCGFKNIENPTVRFGAVSETRNPTVRFAAVLKRAKILRCRSVRLTAPNRTEPIGKTAP